MTREPPMVWNWESCDWDRFNVIIDRELENLAIPDNKNLSKTEIDTFVSKIENIFSQTLIETCPKIKLNKSRLIKLSMRSLALIKNKNKIRRKLHSLRNNANYFQFEKTAKNELKLLNNMIKNSIAEDYRSHFLKKISSLDTRNNNIFREIKKISSYKKREELPSIMTNDNNNVTCNTDIEKANGFANQFASVNDIDTSNEEFSEFHMKVEDEIDTWYETTESSTITNFSDQIRASDPYQNMECNSIKFIDSEDLKEMIKSRNNKMSTGADGITNRMLKVLSPRALIFLTILFNQIINLGYYPANWRRGIVIPVHKKGKPKNRFS